MHHPPLLISPRKKLDLKNIISKDFSIKYSNLKLKRAKIPKYILEFVQKNMNAKFKKKPVLVLVEKKNKKLGERRKSGKWMGASYIHRDNSIYIALPKAYLKDPKVFKLALVHELAEILATQNSMPDPHGIAIAYEKRFAEKKLKTKFDRRKIYRRMQELYSLYF